MKMGEKMKKTIRDFELDDKRVIIRCDFNVPMKNGIIQDNTRIIESIPTIKYALEKNAKVILLSHLGRIKQEDDKQNNSLYPVKDELEKLLNKSVLFISDIEKEFENINKLNPKDICLIENTRFYDYPEKRESGNDPKLGALFASLGDIFINDAFGTAHRAHASNVGIASNLPSGIGFLIEKELKSLEKLESPERPYVVMLGGSKVSDKIGIIDNLINKADNIIIGGAMAFTFLKADGINVGKSIVEDEYIEYCKKILEANRNKITLPIDVRVAEEFNDIPYKEILIDEIEKNQMGLDIGSKTVEKIKDVLKNAKTVMWNGPFGVYEFENYKQGTCELIKYITKIDAFTLLGGGDIVAAVNLLEKKAEISHVSTGGGATLEFLEGKNLPGIECIENK